ncbi:hypothetical protein [Streptomyces sp. NPDC014733]
MNGTSIIRRLYFAADHRTWDSAQAGEVRQQKSVIDHGSLYVS